MGDEYLEQFKTYCEVHEKEPPCPCGDRCKYIHPAWVKKLVAEIEQMTHISLAYSKEVVETRAEKKAMQEKIDRLEAELEEARNGPRGTIPNGVQELAGSNTLSSGA